MPLGSIWNTTTRPCMGYMSFYFLMPLKVLLGIKMLKNMTLITVLMNGLNSYNKK